MGNGTKGTDLSVGDFVVAFGQTQTNQGMEKQHHVLAEIIIVGEKDVFATTEASGRVFKICKSRCAKIPEKISGLHDTILIPRIGDLVVSLSDHYSGRERKMGLLIEINDIPGKAITAKLLEGEDTEIVSFDTLIVIERGNRG
jgi:hypothetical protein